MPKPMTQSYLANLRAKVVHANAMLQGSIEKVLNIDIALQKDNISEINKIISESSGLTKNIETLKKMYEIVFWKEIEHERRGAVEENP